MLATLRRPSIAIGATVAIAGVVLASLLPGIPRLTPAGDGAMTELYTLHASHGVWLYGPYSRFGWHHPGPLLFYLYAPWYAMTGHHPAAINAAAVLINTTAAAAIVWMLTRRQAGAESWAILAALALLVWRLGGVIASPWNPHVLILPFAVVLVSAAAVASGEATLMAPLVIAGSLVAQSHLGLVPVVGVLAALVAAAALIARRRDPAFRRAAWWSAAIALLLWLPPIVEAVWHVPGNPARIFAFFAAAEPAARGEVLMPLRVWADFVTAMSSGDPLALGDEPYEPAGGVIVLLMAALQTGLLPLIAWWGLHNQRRFLGWLSLVVFAASITALAALQRQWQIEGTILAYTSAWMFSIGVLNLAVIASALAVFASSLASPNLLERAARAFAISPAIALVLLVVWDSYQFQRVRENALRSARNPDETSRIVENTWRYLREHAFRHPLVMVEAPAWHHSAAVVLDLARSGVDVAVQPELQSMFGAAVTAATPRDVVIHIVDRAGAAALERQPAREVILARDTVFVVATRPTSPVP